jgi:hypothetical protein
MPCKLLRVSSCEHRDAALAALHGLVSQPAQAAAANDKGQLASACSRAKRHGRPGCREPNIVSFSRL